MFKFILPLIAISVMLTGCATTGMKNNHDQLQARVVELEKKIEEKDAEIVDLQYEVKDLTGKVENAKSSKDDAPAETVETVVKASGSDDILRVNVSAEKLQTALKNAGVYNGKVDGKIGAGTKSAIKAFQKAHGLKADGVVGKRTWDELKTFLK